MPIFAPRLTDTEKKLQKLARKKLFEPRLPTAPFPATPTEPSTAAVVNRFGAIPPSPNELPPPFPTAQPEPMTSELQQKLAGAMLRRRQQAGLGPQPETEIRPEPVPRAPFRERLFAPETAKQQPFALAGRFAKELVTQAMKPGKRYFWNPQEKPLFDEAVGKGVPENIAAGLLQGRTAEEMSQEPGWMQAVNAVVLLSPSVILANPILNATLGMGEIGPAFGAGQFAVKQAGRGLAQAAERAAPYAKQLATGEAGFARIPGKLPLRGTGGEGLLDAEERLLLMDLRRLRESKGWLSGGGTSQVASRKHVFQYARSVDAETNRIRGLNEEGKRVLDALEGKAEALVAERAEVARGQADMLLGQVPGAEAPSAKERLKARLGRSPALRAAETRVEALDEDIKHLEGLIATAKNPQARENFSFTLELKQGFRKEAIEELERVRGQEAIAAPGAAKPPEATSLRTKVQELEKQAYARGASAAARASVRKELAATRAKLAALEGKPPARAPTVEEGEAILAKAQEAVVPKAAPLQVGQVVDHPKLGKVTIVDTSDPSIVSVRVESGAVAKAGRATFAKAAPEAVAPRLVATAADIRGLSSSDAIARNRITGAASKGPISEKARETLAAINKKILANREMAKPAEAVTPVAGAPRATEAVPPPPVKPPVTAAGAEGVPPKPGTFAANIRLSKYPEDIRATIKEWADANPQVVQEARRGVRSDAQVLADAKTLVEEMGGKFQRLQRRWKPGEAWNAEELVAIRGTLRAKAERVVEAGKAARAVDSTANQAEFVLALEDAARTQEIVHGVTAEAGRGLRSFRQQAFDAVRSGDAEKMEEIIRRLGGRAKVAEVADALSRLDVNDPIAVNNLIQKATKPALWDYIIELFYNSILSGPKTHIINSLTNTGTTLLSPSERLLGATIEQGLARLQGRPVERFFSEIPADVVGAVSGLKEGVQAGLQTLKTGIRPSQATKWEFTPKAFKGPLGRAINAPSTTLEAADALGFAVNYRQALGALAVRKTKTEGLRGQAYIERLAELKLQPSPEMIKEASKIAEYRLFRQPLGTVGSKLMGFRDSFPALRFVIPFLRTPINLVKFGLERSPVGIVNPELWRNLAAKNPAASDQIARVFLGSMIAAAVAWLFAEGKITGRAPSNAAERDRFYREGKQAFSVRIGDKWIQYQRLEPYNQTFGMVAAAVEAIQDKDDTATQKVADAVFTYSENLMSQTYLSGLSDLLSAMEQPERYGTQYLGRLASGAIPASALLRTTAQMVDPTIRRPQSVAESMQMTVPGLSGNVPPALTAFGEPARRQSPPWSPIQVSPAQQTAIDAELARLGIEVGFVGNTIAGISLTRQEKALFQIIAGRGTAEALARLIPLPAYKSLSDEGKERSIQGVVDAARERARSTIVRQRQQERPSASVSPPTPSFPEPVAPPSAPSQGPGMAPDWLLEKYGKKQPAGVK